ncbi:MAG: hypothetical protein K6F86_01100 [Lachnospiraceae bacterium]|nr:hypothetical protein [Lachnospiraceae bacterium]
MAGKIEQTIDDIYELLEGCKYAAFSNKESIIVNKEDIFELLEELRERTPEEIVHCQNIIANRDTILKNAKIQADEIINQAKQYQSQMVDQNEIMQRAYAQAGEIVNQARSNAQDLLNQATNDANNYQMHAVTYTDQELSTLQDILSKAISSAQDRYEELLSSLNEAMSRVSTNRSQLTQQVTMDAAGNPVIGVSPNISGEGSTDSNEAQSSDAAAPKAKSPSDGIDII